MNLFLPSSSRCRRRYPTCFKTAPVTSWKIRKAQLVSKLWLTRGNLSHVFIYIKGMNMKVWKEKEGLKIHLKYDYNLLYPNVDDLPKITASVCSLSKKCASTLISHNIKTTCLMLCTFSWCLQSNCAPLRHTMLGSPVNFEVYTWWWWWWWWIRLLCPMPDWFDRSVELGSKVNTSNWCCSNHSCSVAGCIILLKEDTAIRECWVHQGLYIACNNI